MPKKRTDMRKLKEVFRLKFELGRTHREIATSCKISPATVSDMVGRLDESGLTWPCDLPDSELEARLYDSPLKEMEESEELALPNWQYIHQELRRRDYHVTLNLLWEEYKVANPDGYYRYSWFCKKYREWNGSIEPVMRQVHKYGDKCFVDFAGDKLPVFDPDTGEMRVAEVFIATLGASNYVYADVCWSQDLPTWIRLHLDMFEYFGGCPSALVPDNLKSGVTKPCYYEPSINISFEEMAKHHGTAVIPARVKKPKDKAKVEGHVLIAERELLAPLRDRTLIGLSGAREAVWERLEMLNSRPFQKLEGSRRELFLAHEKPALKPLPKRKYDEGVWSQAKVHIDYHIQVGGHYYSVPYEHIGKKVEVKVTSKTVEAFLEEIRVASHRRSWKKGGCTTNPEHMPPKHRRHKDWTPGKLASWAESIGLQTHRLVVGIMERRMHPEQGVRAGLGVIRLKKKYGADRLEEACRRAVEFGAYSYKSVESILDKGLDQQVYDPGQDTKPIGLHENIRGPQYYAEKTGESQYAAAANH